MYWILLLTVCHCYQIPPMYKIPNIHMIRHAETIYNKRDLYTGHLDIPIMHNNWNQYQKVNYNHSTHFIHNNKYDVILSSDSLRCKNTIDLLYLNHHHSILYDEHLQECGCGDLTGTLKNTNIFKRTFYNNPPNHNFEYISESILEGGLRCHRSIFNTIHEYNLDDKNNILIVSHKNTLKGFWILYHLYNFYQIEPITHISQVDEYHMKQIDNIIQIYPIPSFNHLEMSQL